MELVRLLLQSLVLFNALAYSNQKGSSPPAEVWDYYRSCMNIDPKICGCQKAIDQKIWVGGATVRYEISQVDECGDRTITFQIKFRARIDEKWDFDLVGESAGGVFDFYKPNPNKDCFQGVHSQKFQDSSDYPVHYNIGVYLKEQEKDICKNKHGSVGDLDSNPAPLFVLDIVHKHVKPPPKKCRFKLCGIGSTSIKAPMDDMTAFNISLLTLGLLLYYFINHLISTGLLSWSFANFPQS